MLAQLLQNISELKLIEELGGAYSSKNIPKSSEPKTLPSQRKPVKIFQDRFEPFAAGRTPLEKRMHRPEPSVKTSPYFSILVRDISVKPTLSVVVTWGG